MKNKFFFVLILSVLLVSSLNAKVVIIFSSGNPEHIKVYEGIKHVIPSESIITFDLSIDAPDRILEIFNPIKDKIITIGQDAADWAIQNLERKNLYCVISIKYPEDINGLYFFPHPAKVYKELRKIRPKIQNIGLLLTRDFESKNKHFVERVDSYLKKRGYNVYHVFVPLKFSNLQFDLNKTIKKPDIYITMPDETVLSYPYFKKFVRISINDTKPIMSLTKRLLKMGSTLSFEPDYFNIGRKIGTEVLYDTTGWDFSPMKILVNERMLEILGLEYEQE